MRSSRKVWLKWLCAAALTGVAVPLSAQPFAPSALAAEGDEQARPERGDYWIGVRCVEVPELLQAQLDLPEGQGVLIDEVVADSPAQKAGLKTFDVIFAVNGHPVADPQSLAAAVGRAGDEEVKIDYLRAGRKQTLSVKPAPRPEAIAPLEQDQRSLRQWVERLGRGPAPMNFRFFHPGMMLPPGVSTAPALPDDMTVTIEKQGDKPAKVTVRQGDKKWEAVEDSLEKLPPEARQFAERMLGFGSFDVDGFQPAPPPGEPVMAPPGWPPQARRDLESRLNKRLDDLNRQIDELRKSIEGLKK
ncbi:MAG TPA: PDZ domain-containing protein [Pirellulales bacterium]|nr:PDZ domain-containing protein [Pirellulales bacterium]